MLKEMLDNALDKPLEDMKGHPVLGQLYEANKEGKILPRKVFDEIEKILEENEPLKDFITAESMKICLFDKSPKVLGQALLRFMGIGLMLDKGPKK